MCGSWKPSGNETFPRKLWQSWKDDSESPTERTAGLSHEWRTVNPEFRYERITDDNADAYVHDNFAPRVDSLFSSITNNFKDAPVMKADYLRYLIMLNEGGVWADIDVKARRPVKTWVPDEYKNKANLVIGVERDHNKERIWGDQPYSIQLAQFVMMAKPHHPIYERLVRLTEKNLEKLISQKKPGQEISFPDIMGTTGPWLFTKIFMDYFTEVTGVKHNGDEMALMEKPRLIGDVLVMPKISFGSLGDIPDDHPDVLSKHFFIGSWLCHDGKMIDGSPVPAGVCDYQKGDKGENGGDREEDKKEDKKE